MPATLDQAANLAGPGIGATAKWKGSSRAL